MHAPPDLSAYALMLACRRLEEAAAQLYGLGAASGDLRLAIGQEAATVGLARALGPQDALFVGARALAHARAAGLAPEALLADPARPPPGLRFDAGSGLDPLWRALGWTAARRAKGGLALAVLDDFDAESGACADALAYGRERELAVALVIEDARRDAPPLRLADEPCAEVDGLDVAAVESATRDLLARVAAEGRSRALHLRLGRHRGFSLAEPDRRRARGEERRPRGVEDALARERLRLIAAGAAEETLEEIDEGARLEAALALAARDRAAAHSRLARRGEGGR